MLERSSGQQSAALLSMAVVSGVMALEDELARQRVQQGSVAAGHDVGGKTPSCPRPTAPEPTPFTPPTLYTQHASVLRHARDASFWWLAARVPRWKDAWSAAACVPPLRTVADALLACCFAMSAFPRRV